MSRRIIFSVIDEFVKALVCTGGSPLIPEDENLYGFFAGGWDFEWYDHLEDAEPGHVKGGVDFPVGTGRHGGTGCYLSIAVNA